MDKFLLRELKNIDNEKELAAIGFDGSYRFRAVEKFDTRLLKVFGLTSAQANILKQTALSVGADCMTHREVITGNIDVSDAILVGNTSALKKIAQKLLHQPFRLKILAEQILGFCKKNEKSLTKLVGVLNVTEDSFSDGGEFLDIEAAKNRLLKLVEDGADMIDIGAESTRPNAKEISAEVQISRLMPIIDFIVNECIQIPISIDTRNSEVAREVLKHGDFIINDVSGLDYDVEMINVVANAQGLIIQHSTGTPEVMQKNVVKGDIMDEIYFSLQKKVDFAREKGVQNIIVDPGIGFGKTKEQNFEILKRFNELESLGCPIMLGLSRKSLLGMQNESNEKKDVMSLALSSPLIERGVSYLRVHNVGLHREYIKIISEN